MNMLIEMTTLAVVLLQLVVAVAQWRSLERLSDRLAEGATDNGETLKGVVVQQNIATRLHVSHAVDAIRNDTKFAKQMVREMAEKQVVHADETRGLLTSIKGRLQWVITGVDMLSLNVKTAVSAIDRWINPKPPP